MDAILRQTGILFLLLALGFLASKLGWLSRETRGGISNILLYIVTPCVIVQSFQYPSSAEKWRAMGVEAAILAAFMLLGLAAGLLAFRKEGGARRATATFGTAMGNVGFMGVPVIGALVGDEGMLYVSVAMAVFNAICWTVGVRVFDKKAFQPKVLATSPVLYSVAIGLLLFLFQWRLPALIDGVTEMVAEFDRRRMLVVEDAAVDDGRGRDLGREPGWGDSEGPDGRTVGRFAADSDTAAGARNVYAGGHSGRNADDSGAYQRYAVGDEHGASVARVPWRRRTGQPYGGAFDAAVSSGCCRLDADIGINRWRGGRKARRFLRVERGENAIDIASKSRYDGI